MIILKLSDMRHLVLYLYFHPGWGREPAEQKGYIRLSYWMSSARLEGWGNGSCR